MADNKCDALKDIFDLNDYIYGCILTLSKEYNS